MKNLLDGHNNILVTEEVLSKSQAQREKDK
jgi:hypothetical protein